jgi:hypothetical protein
MLPEIQDVDQIIEMYNAVNHLTTKDGDLLIIVPLMFHVSVYVNPDLSYNSEDRYCFLNEELAFKAISEYNTTGILKYWQKHHNKSISIAGNNAFHSGEHQIPENALYSVDWNIDELRKTFKY